LRTLMEMTGAVVQERSSTKLYSD